MTVYILDSVKNVYGISEREFLSVVDFGYKELRLPNTIDLFFEFEQIEDYLGFTHNHDCRDKEYFVVMSPELKEFEEIARTILHEMVHIKQDVNNERFNDTWKGTPIDLERDYETLPWEIEAFELEEHLFNKYISGE